MNYYNEHDPKAAAWLRELIKTGLIPNGIVDERSITEVTPRDLSAYTQCHFFAGIGGWSYALQLAGWPADKPVWTGSCPCQPFSTAGKGLAQADERHLWPVFFELVRQCRPEFVFGEQVASAIGHGWLDGVSSDLESEGYACGATVLGAHSVGSPHIRQRLYWVANAEHQQHQGSISRRREESSKERERQTGQFTGHCETCRMADSEQLGLEGQSRHGDNGSQCRRLNQDTTRSTAESGSASGLVLPNSDGCKQGSSSATSAGYGGTAHSAGFWSDFQLIPCRDGKTRRIPTEPTFFPLAHGIPARVVRLRGYGNAIVPQVAAEFIAAFMTLKSENVMDKVE